MQTAVCNKKGCSAMFCSVTNTWWTVHGVDGDRFQLFFTAILLYFIARCTCANPWYSIGQHDIHATAQRMSECLGE